MATRSLGTLTLDLIAKIGGFQQAMDRAARIAAKTAKDIEEQNRRRAEAVARAWQGVAGAIGTIGIAGIGRELIRLGDTYSQLTARISLVTKGQGELDRALAGTFAIAQETRQGLADTSTLYIRLAQSTESLGKSQAQVLSVTRSINQALVISGASAESSAAALIQLGQGFASGVLRGEELNSVLEQAPRLAKAIADGLGVTVGELRALGEQGALTADRVFSAIEASKKKLDDEFKKLPVTVDQALVQVGNSVLRLVGQINEATGATSRLAAAIGLVSKAIDTVADPQKLKTGLAASALVSADKELKRLEREREQADKAPLRIQSVIDSYDKRIAELRPKVAQLRNEFRRLDVEGRISPNDASPAEERRFALSARDFRNQPKPIDTSSLNGLREQLKSITKLRDEAKLGSDEFRKYSAEAKTLEERIKALSGSSSSGARIQRDAVGQLTEQLRDQLERTADLTMEERTLRELQKKEYANISPQRREEILDLARAVDALEKRKEIEKELADQQKERLSFARQAAIDEFEAISRGNDAYQDRIESLINATPTKVLEEQRKTVQDLSDEYLRGRFGIVGSEEAVKLYGETVNTFLGNTADQLEKTKDIGEELGLAFTSAFEDAIVEGKKLSEVIDALGKDIMRLVTRELVTKPFADSITGFVKGLVPSGGNIFSSIGSAIGGLLGFKENGGAVAAGGLYRVNEAGAELLSVGGRDYLMMGAQGGMVTPAASGGRNINLTVQVTAQPGMSRETAAQQGFRIGQAIQNTLSRSG